MSCRPRCEIAGGHFLNITGMRANEHGELNLLVGPNQSCGEAGDGLFDLATTFGPEFLLFAA